MQKACQTGGTGWPLFDFVVKKTTLANTKDASASSQIVPVPVACKTGTANTVIRKIKPMLVYSFCTLTAEYLNSDGVNVTPAPTTGVNQPITGDPKFP